MQYFERTQLELHPGAPAPHDIQLARLGVVLLRRQGQDWGQLPKGKPAPGCRWFAETGQGLCEPFLSYWQQHGLPAPELSSTDRSVGRFGLPLTGPLVGTDGSGRRMLLQWFERARLELRDDAGAKQVVLGALGKEAARFDAAQASRSGHTPPQCAAAPPATAATVQPAGCILPGTEIVIEATGFQPKEHVVGAVTGPDGLTFPLAPMQADARGRITGLNRRMDAPTGLWSVRLRGARSNREAVFYVRIVDR